MLLPLYQVSNPFLALARNDISFHRVIIIVKLGLPVECFDRRNVASGFLGA
jgi:hypothetical protein